ncbi:MAG: hypothetical protein KFB96_06070 [Thiocapsa sp.]|uniref:hypothetical protein n=1 Tax=Thiocapsa sp. TaxID=2024551 RepID=UPI001BD08E49|nr:hypothetical protein [Thiocapsa sp.]QVL50035.1 MAG: hypothetical protein KFB96_06070 [Thiocapsa sp.]
MTDAYLYACYGLTLRSQLQLPELLPLSASSFHVNVAEIDIRLGMVARGGLAGGKQIGPYAWVNARSLWLQVPHVARFLVSEGREILIDPEPGIDEDSLRVFLLGSAFGALLFQRGHLVLHGNAIRIGDRCMVCVGPSGAGKSTLAAGFMRRGYPILADDVVPVDSQCRAIPGFPRIKLWQDVTEKLAIDATDLRRIRPNTEKFNLPVGIEGAAEPLPIRWIYILDSDHLEALKIEPIPGMQRFQPLHNNTYRVQFLQGMALKPEHLKLCGQLAGRIRLARLTRPRKGFNLEPMIDRILADIAEHP